ncbi:MAG: putative manganese-dependent inorganic diphosphatase [Bacilli bacterium]|nr:putative manganese-dependent inorganic diphosphatase [Bacilli bacterium]
MNEILIFGHRKPDTDSVTAAIALSYYKNQLGFKSNPYILSNINRETEFVLQKFGFKDPEFLNDTKLQIKDINYHRGCFINENETILNTYKYMINKNVTGIPLIDKNYKFKGLITTTMILKNIVDNNSTELHSSFDKIQETINGTSVNKVNEEIKGFVNTNNEVIGSNTIYIANKIDDNLQKALNLKIKLLILSNNIKLSKALLEIAKNHKINIIKTKLSIEDVLKYIHLSTSIKHIVNNNRFEEIFEEDYYDDFLSKSTKLGYNNYPVINKEGKCTGLLRITDINHVERKKVILVDHNESSQSAFGLDEADILEIVDHHQLGDVRTNKPINFRNMTVGSTNTIIFSMFNEKNVKIPKKIAGIMLAGILSDTLALNSPTTTEYDIEAVKELANIAKINYEKFAIEMFKKGTVLTDKTKEDLINEDFKVYTLGNKKFAISQLLTLNHEEILTKKKEYIKILEKIKEQKEYELVLFCLTDISSKGTYFLYTEKNKEQIKEAFNLDKIEQGFYINKIISRKQQIVPVVMNALKNVGNR